MPRPPKEVVLSKKEIGARLRDLRLSRDMTQAQLAELLGTRHTNVSGVERGTRGLTIQQVVKLAQALDVSPAEVLGPGTRPLKATNGHLPRRFERVLALPKTKRRVLFDIIDAFLDRHSPTRP